MRLKIKRLDTTIPLPAYGTDEAAGFDLAAAHDVMIGPGQVALVRTGLVIEVPSGYFLAIFARSSTPLKRGLAVANGVGVIDPDYSGPNDEVMIQVLNFTKTGRHRSPRRPPRSGHRPARARGLVGRGHGDPHGHTRRFRSDWKLRRRRPVKGRPAKARGRPAFPECRGGPLRPADRLDSMVGW
jgi:dUTP pyrophosphatase